MKDCVHGRVRLISVHENLVCLFRRKVKSHVNNIFDKEWSILHSYWQVHGVPALETLSPRMYLKSVEVGKSFCLKVLVPEL